MPDINIDNTNSRHNPSDDYVNLVKMYEEKHDQGEGMFNGRSLLKFVDLIKLYLENNNCKSVLDYGCGKAVLYTDKFSEVTDEIDCPLPEYWGLDECELFDPGYEKYSKLPIHRKDAVICTDVLEHIPTSDLGWVADEILERADKMVFLNIACYPALKTFKDGTNVHISIFSPKEWIDFFMNKIKDHSNLAIYLFFDVLNENNKKVTLEGFKIDTNPRLIQLKEEVRDARDS